ncbi:MAG: PHP domain-containing protein [Candidatus Hydrogenedentota bacterium]
MDKIIDLHIHSNASDGSFTPSEIINLACEIKISAISITDHDTINGQKEALSCKTSIEVIPGVEVSTDYSRMLHILGYCFDIHNQELNNKLEYFRNGRKIRNELIIKKLNELGMKIKLDEVLENAADGVPGRPHIAQVLLTNGYVKTIQQAFDKYLKKGAVAYFNRAKLLPDETIRLIKQAGGIPVMAHPIQTGLAGDRLVKLVKNLKDCGLAGIEVWYSAHSDEQTKFYQFIAKKFRLIQTGGTDFHGKNKPDIKLGKGFGNLKIPYSCVKSLKKSNLKF